MGQEIHTASFTPAEFATFAERLAAETRHVEVLAEQGGFAQQGRTAGFELEAWLLDCNSFPAPQNQALLARLAHPLVVPELSLFNVEFNGTPQPLAGKALSTMLTELAATWGQCLDAAHELEATAVAIGILPTLRESDLDVAHMTPSNRYAALNREVLRLRGGAPIELEIDGPHGEHLSARHGDVMLEAGTTSFQVHLQVGVGEIVRHLNASMVLSAPLVAIAANSPFLFGQRLWHETRIALFEQAVHTGGERRVTFGHGYMQTPAQQFSDNLARYPVLLPILADAPLDAVPHLRLHNGTIWRWNRLLVGEGATPHLRIEQRVMPAGPSLVDMMANAAFYYGAVHMLARQPLAPEARLPFSQARANFYAAARNGLDAEITWLDGRRHPITEVLAELLPLAREGLERMDVDGVDIDHLLGVIAQRLRTRRNGAAWQLAHHAQYGDFFRLTADYLERQRSGMPVHEWTI